MKHKTLLFTFTAMLALGMASCSKNESATTAADDANKADQAAETDAAKTAAAAQAEAAKVADAARAEAARTAEAARATEAAKVETAKAEAVKAADNSKIQGLIDKAKSLVAESKFSDASALLQQLTGQSLTVEQTKLVDSLKEQIQKALAAKAGNLLK